MSQFRFLEPVDVLFLRSNRPFGDPGSFGESLLPPWPSVAAGALRSQIHSQCGKVLTDAEDFRVTAFHIARKQNAHGIPEPLYALPADLVVAKDKDTLTIQRMHVRIPATGLLSSAPLASLPILAQDSRTKPVRGYWLTAAGWAAYLAGATPGAQHLVASEDLWKIETRVGVGLDRTTRRADDGKLFSMQAIAFDKGVGFLVATAGREPVPDQGVIRFGGDGRGATLHAATSSTLPQADHEALANARKARLVLTTPGMFPDGWKLPGMRDDGTWQLAGIEARVVAAAVSRADVISGWDLAKWLPKPAERVAPIGSVYWLEDLNATPEALDKLAERGLWSTADNNDTRRVEGFNRFSFAAA